jgi:type VI protein secretion system component VasK
MPHMSADTALTAVGLISAFLLAVLLSQLLRPVAGAMGVWIVLLIEVLLLTAGPIVWLLVYASAVAEGSDWPGASDNAWLLTFASLIAQLGLLAVSAPRQAREETERAATATRERKEEVDRLIRELKR